MSSDSIIINRGRGPEIAGTRITVFDIMDYTSEDWDHEEIAELFRLSVDQVAAAVEYIEQHEDELLPQYLKMLVRDMRGNPPEIQAKLDAIREKMKPVWEELRRKRRQANGNAGDSSGC